MSAACKIDQTFAAHLTSCMSLAVESSQEVQDKFSAGQRMLYAACRTAGSVPGCTSIASACLGSSASVGLCFRVKTNAPAELQNGLNVVFPGYHLHFFISCEGQI